MKHLDTIYSSKASKTQNLPLSLSICTPPFCDELQRAIKTHHQKEVVEVTSNACQIRMQGLKLREYIHQKLTMSRLNDHDNVQHTLNARITRSRRWKINNGRQINILLSCGITWRRKRRRCDTRRRLNIRAFRASSYLSSSLPKEGNTYGSYNVYGLRSKKLI